MNLKLPTCGAITPRISFGAAQRPHWAGTVGAKIARRSADGTMRTSRRTASIPSDDRPTRD